MKKYTHIHFTIVELLIVISIIVILANMFLPALQSAKRKGLQIACTNKFKQIGCVYSMYMNDYNDFLASSCDSERSRVSAKLTDLYLNTKSGRSYYENYYADQFFCPAYSTPYLYMKHTLNAYPLMATKINTVKKPSQTVAYFDGAQAADYPFYINSTDTSRIEAQKRHNGKANYLMMDTHIELLAPKQILLGDGNTDPYNNRWRWYPPYQ